MEAAAFNMVPLAALAFVGRLVQVVNQILLLELEKAFDDLVGHTSLEWRHLRLKQLAFICKTNFNYI